VVDIQTVSIAIASAGVFAAAVYYIFQIRHQTRIRKTDLLTRLLSIYGSKEHTEALMRVLALEFRDYNDFVKKYGPIPSLSPDTVAFRMISMFAEELGMLLRRGLIDPDMAYSVFSVGILWEKLRPIVEGVRKHFNEPRLFEDFEYLYNEMKKREQKGAKNG